MLRYYITDRRARAWSIAELLANISRTVADGVDYIQIREKDLTARDLFDLTAQAVEIAAGSRTAILVNDRLDVALAANAAGVHLRSESIQVERFRSSIRRQLIIGVSCHSIEDVVDAQNADFLVFGPVFDSPGKGKPQGLEALSLAAAASKVPVLALGGVNHRNAQFCVDAGAAGIAAIRMFQENL